MEHSRLRGIKILAIFILMSVSCSLFQEEDTLSSMNEAINKVVDEILPAEVPDGATYLCIRMDKSIPEGSIIMEASLDDNPSSLITDEESFFFLLDLAPRTFYAHPVKYIVVGQSGYTRVMEANWWPRINNETPDQFLVSLPDLDYVVAGNADLTPVTGNLMEFDFDSIKTQYSEGFIVVKGLMPGEAHYEESDDTYFNGLGFFRSYTDTSSAVVGLHDSNAADFLVEIDRMVVVDGRNLITIYIIAHGRPDGVSLGGIPHSVMQFRKKLAEHPGTLFNLMLSFCHSGSFVDDLQTLSNVRVIGTACAADEGGKPDIDEWGGTSDINREDSGSEWTSSVLRAASDILGSHSRWLEILSRAAHHGMPTTCIMLYAAMRGALGRDPGLGLTVNFDLSNVVGLTDPQIYRSW
jgi:hypothetical protein